jgi:hypothetical protein
MPDGPDPEPAVTTGQLPVEVVLPALHAALVEHGRVVLEAPPGAGKTTRAPLDLLARGLDGRLVLLEPRRVAARAAAARLATQLGDAALAAQARHHQLKLLLRRELPVPAVLAQTLLSISLSGPSSDASRTEPRRLRRLAHHHKEQSEPVNTGTGSTPDAIGQPGAVVGALSVVP